MSTKYMHVAVDPDGQTKLSTIKFKKAKFTIDGSPVWWWDVNKQSMVLRNHQKRPTPFMGIKPGQCGKFKLVSLSSVRKAKPVKKGRKKR